MGLLPRRRNLARHHDRDAKRLTGKSPGGLEGLKPLALVFDHIQDEAEIDHVGWASQAVRA